VYPAPNSNVSASLEEMIAKEFPPNKNIVWHKTTYSQKKYYWVMKTNGNDEVRVKVGSSGTPSKAGKYLRFNLSINNNSSYMLDSSLIFFIIRSRSKNIDINK